MPSDNEMGEAIVTIHDDDDSQLAESQTQPCIYKVYKHLRDVNNQAYDPQIIAIGPYHHGKKDLQMMEEHKLRYLEELLRPKGQDFEQYCTSVMKKLEKRAQDCYAEPINLDPEDEFIKMLVLDGCFIIELLKRWGQRDSHRENDPIFRMDWIMNSLQRDLILFENQIPFFVLCELFDLIEAPKQHEVLIDLILDFFKDLYPAGKKWVEGYKLSWKSRRNWGEIKHLLDLIHTSWEPSFKFDIDNNNVTLGLGSAHDNIDMEKQPHFIFIFYIDRETEPLDRKRRFVHSATELKDANVKFSTHKSDQIINTLFHVDFDNGKMVMPELIIEDRTECIFRNLIAFEQYFPCLPVNFVTEYVKLLDCLINSVKDVEILLKGGLIDNRLGDNEVVADIFNKLTISVTGAVIHFMYTKMALRVNEHCCGRWNRWWAMLRRDYFKSPWAYITFFTAVILLLLTVAQTVCSVLQVK